MSDEDVYALVAYMNSLLPVRNPLPGTSINLWRIPGHDGRVRGVPHSGKARGADSRQRLAGGREFRLPVAVVVSGNITRDADTGIGKWSEQQFLDKFYQYKEYAEKGSPQVGPEGYTLMPWLGLSQLPPEELGAIYAYLMSQPVVRHAVETHPGQPQKL